MKGKERTDTMKKLYIELKKTQEKLHGIESAQHEPIALIGMGCRFPGGANNPELFWELIKAGKDAVTDVPPERWDSKKYYDPDPGASGKMYTVKGGFLTCPVNAFDASFFNISPKEARALDPQQRLLLEVTWEAMEDAALDIPKMKGSRTGVFIGMSSYDYTGRHIHSGQPALIDAYSLTGITFSTAAGRLSYTFGFEGPCITIDTACSSAFAALHYALCSLRSGESEMAIVGGVNLLLAPEIHICFSKLQAISPDGKCKTFDASANGYVRGEGCGVVILKRLADALQAQDRILAVIRGSAINQDGKSSGLTAPNGKAQEKVIARALLDARLSPGDIDYIEAHGTGTALGDPIEVEALGNIYGMERAPNHPLLLGSVKTNIGHLEPAAGISGLIKTIQALGHGAIPPSIHFKTPNPYIPWDKFPVKIVTGLTPWEKAENGTKRRAGLSAFGFSGTNVHVIVEEAPPQPQKNTGAGKAAKYLLTFAAGTDKALKELAGKYSAYLAVNNPEINDICYTSHVGRTHFQSRLAVIGATKEEIKDKLAAYCTGESAGVLTGEEKENKKIAFLFTGQGSQYVGMGRGLYMSQPVFREAIKRCDELFCPLIDKSIVELLYSGSADEALIDQTHYTQPLIFTIQYALAKLWESWGIRPSAVVGHSIGEFAAAVTAGIMSFEDAGWLAVARGRLMQAAPGSGAMGVIMADEQSVQQAIGPYQNLVSIATVNAEKNIAISGDSQAVKKILAEVAGKGIKTRLLQVSHAFHSSLMDPILEEFEKIAAQVTFSAPKVTFVSSLNGEVVSKDGMNAGYWTRQIRETVRFYDALKTLAAGKYELYLEIGAAPILSSLGAQIITDPGALFIPSLRKGQDDWEQALTALGQLYTAGVDVDWEGLEYSYNRGGQKVSLPTYPFQRQKYWAEVPSIKEAPGSAGNLLDYHPLLGQKLSTPLNPDTFIYQSIFTKELPFFMQEHIIYSRAISPAAGHVSMALSAAGHIGLTLPLRLEQVELITPLAVENNDDRIVQLVIENTSQAKKSFQLLSRLSSGETRWEKHCTGFITSTNAAGSQKICLPIEEMKKRCRTAMDLSWFYENLHQVGYHLGPGFRRITEIWKGEHEGLFKMDFSRREEIPGHLSYEVYPGFIDSIFQAVIPTADNCIDNMMNKGKIYIPISAAAVNYYRPLPETAWCSIKSEENEIIIKGDCTLFAENGEILLEIQGLAAKQTDRDTLYGGKEKDYHRMFYELQWEEKLLNLKEAPKAPGPLHLVVFQGRKGITMLGQGGFHQLWPGSSCMFVHQDNESRYCRTREDAYTINPSSIEDFRQLFKELDPFLRNAGSPVNFLCLGGLEIAEPGKMPGEITGAAPSPEKTLAATCVSLTHMIRTLAESQLIDKVKLWIITRHAQELAGETQSFSPWQAPLWGLGRTITQEYPGLLGGLIDIDDTIMTEGILNLVHEMMAGEEEQICLRNKNKRYAARLTKTGDVLQKKQPGEFRPVPKGTYLITGGTGALGLEVARWLKECECHHLVLMARKEPGPREQAFLAALGEGNNQPPTVLTGDISQPGDVERIIGIINRTMPPLRGVIHAAGVLDDATLSGQDEGRFQRVFAPKVQGAWNLHLATLHLPLDFFVMFSSAAAWMGSAGQANYAAANEFLNALARCRRKQGLPGLSIGWGPWAGKGMAAAQTNRNSHLSQQGIYGIQPPEGLKVLQRLMACSSEPCIMVLDIDWNRYSQYALPKQKNGVLSRFILPGLDPKTITDSRQENLVLELENTPPPERPHKLLSYLKNMAGKVMGFDKTNQVDVNKPLAEQGLDSLMVIDIRNRLAGALQVKLSATLLYEYPTLEQLMSYLLDEVFPGKTAAKGEKSVQPTGKNSQTTSQLLAEINTMVED